MQNSHSLSQNGPKRILLIYYSQSGQLLEIAENFLRPLNRHDITFLEIKPVHPFPFPWTSERFFDAMPETVLEQAIEIEKTKLVSDNFDLVILAYQPWFLSPSLPVSSFLKSPEFKNLVSGKPVITLIGARNMWINAQESVKNHIKNAGGFLAGNIPLIDRHSNSLSAVSIMYWMFTGKKEKFLGFFPKPGVSSQDISEVEKFGEILENHLKSGDINELQKHFLKTGKINISTQILFIEQRAKKIFLIWAKLILAKSVKQKARKLWVRFFKFYLLFALFIIAPLLYLVFFILILPFNQHSIKKKKAELCQV